MRLAEFVGARDQLDVADVGWSLAGRSTFEHRAVVLGDDRGQLLAGLGEVAEGLPGASVITGHATPAGKTVFVFPGQGSQWIGMGVELLDTAPVFAEQMNACAEAFAEFVDWSLIDVLRGAPGAPGLDRVDVVQPALFAVMVSLAELWRSIGVRPDAVIGHSQGEIAAAYVAGALSLRDAAQVVTLRSKLLLALSGRGGMASLACGPDQARELLAPYGDRVSIAAVNGRSAVVLSGDEAALDEIVARAPNAKCGPAVSTSTTHRTRLPSTRSVTSSLKRWQVSSRSRPARCSSPPSPAGFRTPRASMPTTGSATSGRRSNSTRRCAPHPRAAIGPSSSPARIRR